MMLQVLTGAQVAEMLGLQEQTLRAWRVRGSGPAYVRYGSYKGRVRYRLEDIEAWLEQRKYQSTSAEAVVSRQTASEGES